MVKGKIPKDERSLGNIFQIIIDFLSRCVQLTFFIGMTIFILISYIFKIGLYGSDLNIFSTLFITVLWSIIIIGKFIKTKEKSGEKPNPEIILIIVLLCFMGILFLINGLKAYDILRNKPFYDVKIITNNQQYKSNDSIVFVGQTKEYFYIYNLKTKENIIINNQDVETIYLRRKNRLY